MSIALSAGRVKDVMRSDIPNSLAEVSSRCSKFSTSASSRYAERSVEEIRHKMKRN